MLVDKPMDKVVMHYAKNAADSGLDGVVCSPLEAGKVLFRLGQIMCALLALAVLAHLGDALHRRRDDGLLVVHLVLGIVQPVLHHGDHELPAVEGVSGRRDDCSVVHPRFVAVPAADGASGK